MAETTRDRILDAATRAFVAEGLAGARIDAIAKDAGCNKQLIYHHFGDKEGLYVAVIERELSQKPLPRELGADSFDTRLLELFRKGKEDSDWYRLMLWEALQFGDQVVGYEQRRQHIQLGIDLIREAQCAGWISDEHDAEVITLSLIGLSVMPWMLPQLVRLVTGKSSDDTDFREAYERLLVDLMSRVMRRAADCPSPQGPADEARAAGHPDQNTVRSPKP